MKKLTIATALVLAAPVLADGQHIKPGKYHIVVTHEMEGLPFKPPPTAIDKCVTPEDAKDTKKLSHHNDKCEEKELKQTGNKLVFSVVCHDRGGTQTGTGEYVFGESKWSGTITVAMQTQMGPAKMVSHVESTRVGDCTK